ncbi:ALK and LTK ligand 2b [Dicentrarchus labrax]|uniref:Protein FAM150B n=1 Tax=Dicentrarchus labrax TaxID=13489 RepID=A0A8P4K3V0_DICLA|nr:ALK and LTK ligand 2b [Dicentrarchus labrax]XP_051283108.1 ALK and LTK ligand 2b [Dicentrarchus labrax]XP_051283109.1 ALK and LTK ligand 2b [Dicentrarchus labrax]XP_051283110.1 ALK and LTK ligand 2b [Dicentrarchus labrax]
MMRVRFPVLLVLLAAALLRSFGGRAERQLDGRSLSELIGRIPRTGTGVRQSRGQPGPEAHHQDPRYKEKLIIHLTGPLYFNPKCRKHFNRLYHNTRECTVPAYYKRCARLLTRLASSPRCAER